jgi:hypothetical protein
MTSAGGSRTLGHPAEQQRDNERQEEHEHWPDHGRYVTFQLAEVAVPQQMFAEILMLIARLRAPPTVA